ncbi:MAG: hypothetical protein OXK17_05105 [Thaumarchaeota archaeon]|nr:hypothetical protein [Nitrososphaerota archaeon]
MQVPLAYADYVQSGLPDDATSAIRRTIDALCRKSTRTKAAAVYDEGRDDGRSTVPGWLVPLSGWELAMRQPLSGRYVEE